MRDHFQIRETYRSGIEQRPPRNIGTVWIIYHEEDALDTKNHEGTQKRRYSEVPARGYVEIGSEIVTYPALQVSCRPAQHQVGPGKTIRYELTHVAHDDLQLREAVENSGHDEPEAVEARFRVPAPTAD